MSRVWKCDVCGKINPRSIRRLCTSNPSMDDTPLNCEPYYAFNIINEDICDECLNKLERDIANRIHEMQKEIKNGKEKSD